MSELLDKRALVLGVDAIGSGIALRFAREGAALALLDADPAAAEATAQSIRQAGGSALPFAAPWDGVDAAVTQAIDALGGLDVLVVNPLPQPEIGPLEAQSAAVFDAVFTRVRAAAAAMQAALAALSASGAGRIIVVGHRYGENVNEGIAAYNAAAWSLVGLVRSAATDWGQHQIATNLLLPLANTPELQACRERRPRVIDTMIGQLPLGRAGDPVEDVGGAALFLAGDACNFVNGEIVHGDGGQHVAGPVLSPGKFGKSAG